jgi:hypothetical protein
MGLYSFYSIREVKSQLIWRQSKANAIKNLNSIGFELLDDKENKTVERLKNLIIDLVYYKTEQLK